MEDVYPIFFRLICQSYVWGGKKIHNLFGKELEKSRGYSPRIAEAWLASDRKEGMSIVENGAFRNMSLHALVQMYGEDFLGKKYNKFPLLIKLLDARESLSIQVHPDEKSAQVLHAEPKTEMWYVLSAEKNASVLVGFSEKMDPNLLQSALKENTLVEKLKRFSVEEDDAVFIPGGTIHAILHGCFILEVQQNSNSTYRIYDWNRGRKLHIKEACSCLSWEKNRQGLCKQTKNNEYISVHKSEHFCMEKWEQSFCFRGPFTSFQAFLLVKGKAFIEVNGNRERLSLFRLCIAFACSKEICIECEEPSVYIRIYLP